MWFILGFFAFMAMWLAILTKKAVSVRERNKLHANKNLLILQAISEIKKILE